MKVSAWYIIRASHLKQNIYRYLRLPFEAHSWTFVIAWFTQNGVNSKWTMVIGDTQVRLLLQEAIFTPGISWASVSDAMSLCWGH